MCTNNKNKLPNTLSRVWLMGHGYKRVPNPFDNDVVFWVKRDGTNGYQIKNESASFQTPFPTTRPTSKDPYDARRKQRYLNFRDAFGHHNGILASHAVYTAFVGPIPEGMVIDHLNGITTDNRPENLQPVTYGENNRRAGILRAMRAAGIDPTTYSREELLAIFGKYTVEDPREIMLYDLTHRCEE